MNILLTNDDGIGSPSLLALAERLKKDHNVWIVAPDKERSGSSHSISLKTSLVIKPVGPNAFSCSGTPADCVLVSVLGLVKEKIELVISGPNLGANLGSDIIYSGTVAAARQAAFMHIPAIAASLVLDEPTDILKTNSTTRNKLNGNLEYAVEFLTQNLVTLWQLSEQDHFININFPPNLILHEVKQDIAITFPSIRIYNDVIHTTSSQNGEIICEIYGDTPVSHYAAGSDYEAIKAGSISISPVPIHPGYREDISHYLQANFWTAVNEE